MSSSDSKSDSSQTQTQESQDNRISGAGESVNLVASRSSIGNVSISQTDHGAVDGAFKFGNAITDGALKFADSTVTGALGTIKASVKDSLDTARAAQDSAYKFSNAVSDSAFKSNDAALGGAFKFAADITAGAANELAAAGARSDAVAKNALQSVKDAYGDMGQKLDAAYTNSKAGEQKVLVGVGLALVAVVAFKAMGKA
ncbi:hypothetical protein [Janthinobacterium sp.]|uniref:hypothetical protein n=1 Tax=Janthinobacterium sp. TaxID=1871054 RepID=UPI002587BED8|nr:hypothetical protein [Janthinobacterium sp.]MCX7289732.1 hypothetical protein [Janthinobacterium sp.]